MAFTLSQLRTVFPHIILMPFPKYPGPILWFL
jgi:hypothetical protein